MVQPGAKSHIGGLTSLSVCGARANWEAIVGRKSSCYFCCRFFVGMESDRLFFPNHEAPNGQINCLNGRSPPRRERKKDLWRLSRLPRPRIVTDARCYRKGQVPGARRNFPKNATLKKNCYSSAGPTGQARTFVSEEGWGVNIIAALRWLAVASEKEAEVECIFCPSSSIRLAFPLSGIVLLLWLTLLRRCVILGVGGKKKGVRKSGGGENKKFIPEYYCYRVD